MRTPKRPVRLVELPVGASLNRPGLDSLRDAAAMAEFEVVLVAAPDSASATGIVLGTRG